MYDYSFMRRIQDLLMGGVWYQSATKLHVNLFYVALRLSQNMVI